MITYVTAFMVSDSINRSVDQYFHYFDILAKSGVSIILFLDKCFKNTNYEKNILEHGNVHIPEYISIDKSWIKDDEDIILPENRNKHKDTVEYMCIQLMKMRLVRDALKYTDSDYLAWIDFGIFHTISDTGLAYSILNNFNMRKFRTEKIIAPGSDVYTSDNIWNNLCWYFRGSFFVGYRGLFENAYRVQMDLVAENYPKITWEINYWYLMRDLFIMYVGYNDYNIINIPDMQPCTKLCEIMERCGSDKGGTKPENHHNYTQFYYDLFKHKQFEKLRIFELGLGTNNLNFPCNMGIHGIPGASLRGWCEFFPNSHIYGADIDKGILFKADRISTFYCDQTDPSSVTNMWNTNPELEDQFDIIIEDGLHEPQANICFFENSIHKLKKDGIFIIENVKIADIAPISERCDRWIAEFCVAINIINIINPCNHSDNNIFYIKKL